MKKVFKWLLGILIGLLLVVILAGGAFLVFNRGHIGGFMMNARNEQYQEYRRGMPWQNTPGQRTPRNTGPGYELPMHPFWGARQGVFRPLGMLFGCLIGIGFLVLAVLGVVALVKPRHPASTTAVSPATVAPAAQPTPAAIHSCPHCGRPVQDDWSHCPYCGGPLTGQAEVTTPQA
jgi:hypothetical protein